LRTIPLAALLLICHTAAAQSTAEKPMTTQHATGLFEVKMPTLALADEHAPPYFGRRALDKQYHGPLKATGKGEMLAAMTAVEGSAAYVAIEQVSGTLDGKKGSFALQHSGLMTRGTPQLSVVVVPDSGSDELTGLTGKMAIRIEGGKHYYDFDYTLP